MEYVIADIFGATGQLPPCDALHDGWQYWLSDSTYMRCVLSACSVLLDRSRECALEYGMGGIMWGWQHHYP